MEQQILVVEDDDDHRSIVRSVLEHAGFDVVEATDGEGGVQQALELRPAVVLMDVSLPRLDGWSATLRIKNEAPDQCVIIVTAHAYAEDRALADAAGADHFITKPVEPQELLRIVQSCTGILPASD